MKTKTSRKEDGEDLAPLLSGSAFALLVALALATPFFEMTGLVPAAYKAYKIYAYGLLLGIQLALVPLRGVEQSIRLLATPVIIALLWFAVSLAWSQNFGVGSRRFVLLTLIYWGMFASVGDLGYERSLRIVRVALAAALALNWVAAFALPDIARQEWEGYELWCGLMAHKNIAGLFCAITIVVFATDGHRLARPLRYGVIVGAAIFLVQTWSRTAFVATIIALAFGLALSLVKADRRFALASRRSAFEKAAWALFTIALAAILLLTIQRDLLLSFTDDASSLSLRNAIWRPMIQYYLDNPILGSGYGAFWDSSADVGSFGTQKWMRNVDQGHNGYLDLLVQSGLPGLTFALVAAWAWPIRQFMPMFERAPARSRLVFSLVLLVSVENFSESSLFADDALGNVFLLFALAQLHRFAIRSGSASSRHRSRSERSLAI